MTKAQAKKRLLAFETKVYVPAMAWIVAQDDDLAVGLEHELVLLHDLLRRAAVTREPQIYRCEQNPAPL